MSGLMSVLVKMGCKIDDSSTKPIYVKRQLPLKKSKEEFMVATKTQALDKQKALQLINNFFDQFKNCCKQKQSLSLVNFDHILSHDFQNTSNGKLIGKNIQDFLRRMQEIQQEYSHVEFSHLHDCLISGNKIAIQYDMNLTLQNGQKRLLNIMAIATLDGDLITHWSQVSHEKHHLNSK